ncbi:outer membrane protein assembly factor BamA [PVC group bacterium (ex Bugula neritina AB1)]|nr:outer membrane protein assembly factor BamA [PVC group bacterium (ex Bugula neritina AB1)]
MKNIFFKICFIFILSLSFNISSLLASDEGSRIVDVEIVGNVSISTESILSQLESKKGGAFRKDVLSDDMKRIYSLGYFSDIDIEMDDVEEGVVLTFVLEEKFSVASIKFEGNKVFRKKELFKELPFSEGDIFNKKTLHEAVKKIEDKYWEKGFYKVQIDPQVTVDNFARKVDVVVMIYESYRVFVKKINILGNEHVSTAKLKKMIKLKEKWFFGSGVFKEDLLEEDVQRLQYYYNSLGYVDAVIEEPELTYEDDSKALTVTLRIKEGKMYRVGILEIKGVELFPLEEVRSSLKMVEGEPFNQLGLLMDQRAIQDYYSDRGHVHAKILPSTFVTRGKGIVDVTYKVEENELVHIEKILIQGNTRTKDNVIRRELKVHPLEPFNGEKMKKSRQKLFRLNYFEDVAFETTEGTQPGYRHLLVNVKEKKTGEFSFGGGYSSIDKFVGFIEIAQNNFDLLGFPFFVGGGQRLDVRAEIGGTRKNYSFGFTEPWLAGKPLLLGMNVYNREWDRDDYRENRKGASVRMGHPFGEDTYILGHFKSETVKIDIEEGSDLPNAITLEAGEKYVNTLGFRVSRDTRDNIQFPTKGSLHTVSLETTGGFFGGDVEMIRSNYSSNWYFKVTDMGVLDARFRLGFIRPSSEQGEIPFYERFYAGGGSTVRGYEDRAVGPQEDLEPIGGNSTFIFNLEYSFPLVEMIRGALFVDTGNVWKNAEDVTLKDLKTGVGVGVRIKTPLGPVKLDYGFALDAEEHEDDSRLHFSMGGFF